MVVDNPRLRITAFQVYREAFARVERQQVEFRP